MPDRIRLSRAKGWRMPEGAVKVDRATIWGNPWRVGKPGVAMLPREPGTGWEMEALVAAPIDAALAAACYSGWLDGRLEWLPDNLNGRGVRLYRERMKLRRAHILSRLPELRGRPLACWCALDAPCHADVLLEKVNA